jgi:nucleoside-diphosphate-sugar epimerase
VYGSTSGVYGDRQGRWVSEHHPCSRAHARAWRRVDAERWVRAFGRATGTRTAACAFRASTHPTGKVAHRASVCCAARPCCEAEDDVYTNHIHADDLARACALALWRARPQRNVNVVDDTDMLKMGDYFDLAADLYGLPRPPRLRATTPGASCR